MGVPYVHSTLLRPRRAGTYANEEVVGPQAGLMQLAKAILISQQPVAPETAVACLRLGCLPVTLTLSATLKQTPQGGSVDRCREPCVMSYVALKLNKSRPHDGIPPHVTFPALSDGVVTGAPGDLPFCPGQAKDGNEKADSGEPHANDDAVELCGALRSWQRLSGESTSTRN